MSVSGSSLRHSARAWGLCLASLSATVGVSTLPAPASGQSPDASAWRPSELARLHTQLSEAQPRRREAALTELLTLPEDALPAIAHRVAELSGTLDRQALLATLPTLRRTRVLAPRVSRQEQTAGLLLALEQDRTSALLHAVEIFAIVRALERQHSIAASELLVNSVFALEPRLLRAELTRARKRLGKLLIPAYLRGRASAEGSVKKLSREGLVALGMTSEARLFQVADVELLAAITRVESELSPAEALPFAVANLDDPRTSVRRAAREAVAKRVDEAADLLRQRWIDLFGDEPDARWPPSRVLGRLVEQVDATASRPALAALTAAQQALRKGDLELVERQLDGATAHGLSDGASALAATTYLELGHKYDEANRTDRALVAYRRAHRVATPGADRKTARARLLYLEAEQRVAHGIADLQTLRTAAALEPDRRAAADLAQELSGARIEEAQQMQRRLGMVAAVLLALTALLVLRIRATNRRDASAGALARTTKSPST